MLNPLEFSSYDALTNCKSIIYGNTGDFNSNSFLINFLLFNKMPENPVITPSTTRQVVYPSANNRYLASVTIEATPTTTAG
jgi:hypothetical protein